MMTILSLGFDSGVYLLSGPKVGCDVRAIVLLLSVGGGSNKTYH
jgi:hypothetical protein